MWTFVQLLKIAEKLVARFVYGLLDTVLEALQNVDVFVQYFLVPSQFQLTNASRAVANIASFTLTRIVSFVVNAVSILMTIVSCNLAFVYI